MRIVRRALLALVVVLLIVAVAAAFAAAAVNRRLQTPFKGYPAAEQFVEIESGLSVASMADRFTAAGIVVDPWTFRLAVWLSGDARRLKAGEYKFDREMTPAEVVAKLARGEVFLLTITFPEGLTVREMARLAEQQGFGTADAFVAGTASALGLITSIDPDARDAEGYLFPDTYAVPRRTTPEQLARIMINRFLQVFDESLRQEAKARGLTVREAVTLASLVEKETAKADERPVVAAVYANRLRIHMGLQCDPTVIYALMRDGRYTGNLTHADLSYDSPYNTYKYAGLPPGPIAAPGRSSLVAALRPAMVDYLYFVSRNDGSHEFATTLAEHNRNVQEFQVQYFRERRLREQGK